MHDPIVNFIATCHLSIIVWCAQSTDGVYPHGSIVMS
jgi:hypothetical protein